MRPRQPTRQQRHFGVGVWAIAVALAPALLVVAVIAAAADPAIEVPDAAIVVLLVAIPLLMLSALVLSIAALVVSGTLGRVLAALALTVLVLELISGSSLLAVLASV